ncbi:MAG: nicotinate-nucleotide adenylyltransferase [Chloroflexi bacterium]|nr:nicotinate-nucleotide adenylyltransferase [Chloroflexota bacterium]
MDIGIFGGTFDPVHMGHLIVAEEVRIRLKLSVIVFLPAGQPWMKRDRVITEGDLRLEMIRLAICTNPYFQVSTIELERSGPTYSIDTIRVLKQHYGDVGLYFILGQDSLAEMYKWKAPEELIETCTIVGVARPNGKVFNPAALEQRVHGGTKKIILLGKPLLDISSTQIRERVTLDESIRYLVPDPVADYIKKKKLYIK